LTGVTHLWQMEYHRDTESTEKHQRA